MAKQRIEALPLTGLTRKDITGGEDFEPSAFIAARNTRSLRIRSPTVPVLFGVERNF